MGYQTAANNVLGMINKIEQNRVDNPHPRHSDNIMQKNHSEPVSGEQGKKGRNQSSALQGQSQYLQGKKLPQVFKQQSKNLDKVREDKARL